MKIDFSDETLFGNDAGEDERPEVLASYFLGQQAFDAFLNQKNVLRFARSRKGMGKSALLSKLAFDLSQGGRDILIVRTTGAELVGLLSPQSGNPLDLQNYWIKVLSARINHELAKQIGFAFSDTSMALVESAEIAGYKSRNFVGSLIARVSSSQIPITVNLPSSGSPNKILERALSEFDGKNVWLLVDDIDSTFVNTPDYRLLISTFFSACRYLARDMVNLHIRATVRTDVWTSLRENEDLDKAEQYFVDISWTSQEIEAMLSRKIYAFIKRNFPSELHSRSLVESSDPTQFINLVFTEKMQWGDAYVPAIRPIVILSSKRPRWMSQLCRMAGAHASKEKHGLIAKTDISFILHDYTKYRLSDIYKEHLHQFTDLKNLIETFSNSGARYNTSELISKIVNGYTAKFGANNVPSIDGIPYNSPVQLAHFLFKIGFIAGRQSHGPNNQFANFVAFEDRPELLTDPRNLDGGLEWEIYPSYRDALGIRTSRMQSNKSKRITAASTRRRSPGSAR